MEFIVLLVLWIVASATGGPNAGFPLFLVFAAIAVVWWRLRDRLSQLGRQLDSHAEDAATLRRELKQLAAELRAFRAAPNENAPPAETGVPAPSESAPPVAVKSQPEPKPAAPPPTPPLPTAWATPPATPVSPAPPVSPPAMTTATSAQVPQAVAPLKPAAPAAATSSAPYQRPAMISDTGQTPIRQTASAPAIISTTARVPLGTRVRKTLELEELVGGNLLNKLGIFLLVVGAVSFLATQWQNIPAWGKDLLLLAGGGVLLGGGVFLEKRERYHIFARTLIGGGWAMLFYTSYALYHVGATRILTAQWVDLVLMLATAAAMVWHTLKYRSQVVTGIAYLLAFSTVTISQETVFSLTAGAVLAMSLVVLVQRMRWYELEVFGILASYLNHLRFLYPIISPMGIHPRMFPEFYASTTLLIFYWAVFRTSYVIRPVANKHEEDVSTLACLLNPFLLLGLMKYQSVNPQLAFYALLGLGAVEFTLAQLPITRRRRPAFLVLTTLGATLMIAAVPFRYSGMDTAVLWLSGAEALLVAGVLVREIAFRRLGMAAGLLTAGHLLLVDARPWVELSLQGTPAPHNIVQGVLFIFCAAVLFADAHLLELRWSELFDENWDRKLLVTLSYSAALVAFLGVWTALPWIWVAVGWATLMLGLAVAGKRLSRIELTVQATVVALFTAGRTFAINMPVDHGPFARARLLTVSITAALFYLSARFVELRGRATEFRALFQWTGTAIVAALLWVEVPGPWVAFAWTMLALVLTLAARWLKLNTLLHQCYALSFAALVSTINRNWTLEGQFATHVSLRLITVALVAAGFYVLSLIAKPEGQTGALPNRAAFNTGAALLLGGLIWFEAGKSWVPVLWSVFATALLLLWRRLKFLEFYWQAHALAAVAFLHAYAYNMFSDARVHGWSERLITVSLITAMVYFDSWLSIPEREAAWPAQVADFYSWAGSLLATTLMWHELRPIDVALAWAIFGIVLFELGLELSSASLRWQGGIALCASFIRIFFVNLNAVGEPGHLSPRVYSIVPLALVYLYVYWRTLAREEAFGPSRWRQLAPILFSSLGVSSIAFLIRFEAPAPYVVTLWAAMAVLLLATARWARQVVFLYQAGVLGICTTFRSAMYNLEMPSYFSDTRAISVGGVIALLLLALPFAFSLRNQPPGDLPSGDAGMRSWLRRVSLRPEQLFFFAAVGLLTALIAVEMRRGQITVGWGVEAVAVFVLALWVRERSFRLCGLGLLLLCVGKLLVDVWGLSTRDRTISMTVLGAVLLVVSFLYSRHREAIRKYL